MNSNHILTFLLLPVLILTACSEAEITDKLKEYKIISSVNDRDFLPNQISRTYDWGYIIKDEGLYKIANKEGKISNQTGFKWMPRFDKNGITIVKNSKSKYGIINTNGELIIDTIYQKISNFNDFGLAIITKQTTHTNKNGQTYSQSKKGLININGEFKIEPEYFNITYLKDLELYKINHHSYRQSEHPQKYSLYSATNGWLKNSTYESISKFNNGLAIVINNKKRGVINKSGDLIVPLEYQNIKVLSAHKIKTMKDNKWQTINI